MRSSIHHLGRCYVIAGLTAALMTVENPKLRSLLQAWFDDYRGEYLFNHARPEHIEKGRRKGRLSEPYLPQGMPNISSVADKHAWYEPMPLKAASFGYDTPSPVMSCVDHSRKLQLVLAVQNFGTSSTPCAAAKSCDRRWSR
ncbi:hypothetical protein BDW66DRAFT_4631 [Aspergillus desertorum]